MTMTLELGADLEAVVRNRIDSGKYHDAGEVMSEALRLLQERDDLEELRAKIKIGLDQVERGEGILLTPAVAREMSETAYRKWQEGKQPNPDVLP